jgi:hypothetical protein
VSYQAILEPRGAPAPAHRFEPLDADAIGTRRRDAAAAVPVRVSKAQARWLREVEKASGGAADAGALVRALVDLAAQLDVDWAGVRDGRGLRDAVREGVLVRRPAAAAAPRAPAR